MIIDHDPKPTKRKSEYTLKEWWMLWIIVAALWATNAPFNDINFVSVGLGFVTGIIFILWAVDMSERSKR